MSILGRARPTASAVFAVVGCLLTVVSLVAVWARNQVLDTDRYLATVTPLAHDPVIQDEVATTVAAAINTRLDARLAPNVATSRLVERTTREVTRSDAFPALWSALNRAGHRELVAVLTGKDGDQVAVTDGRLTLDLSSVVTAVRERLVNAGLTVIRRLPPITLVVDVADARDIERAQKVVRLLDMSAVILPIVSLGLLVGSVLAARRRRRSIAITAAGLAVTMAAMWLVIGHGASIAVDRVPTDVASADAVQAYYGHLTSLLRHSVLIVGLAALATSVVAVLAGVRRSPRVFDA